MSLNRALTLIGLLAASASGRALTTPDTLNEFLDTLLARSSRTAA